MTEHAHMQSGNALFIILIAVALLGSLSYAVMQSDRGGVASLTDEKANLYASEIMEFSQIMGNAVAQLRLRGCGEDEISFENDVVSGYTNADAPSNNSCHIFHPSGGGLTWGTPDEAMIVGTASPSSWLISAENAVENIGTSGSGDSSVDLLLLLNDIPETLCLKINDTLDVTNPSNAPPVDNDFETTTPFAGSYDSQEELNDSTEALWGKRAGCFSQSGTYRFYKVLIVR